MKKILIIILIIAPSICISQGMKITWDDTYGREFSINTNTGSFQYSMIAGDKITYYGSYESGPEGRVKSIGNTKVIYYGSYESGPEGYVKSVGNIKIYYYGKYETGPENFIKSVGGLKIYYYGKYESGPEGSIKRTFGSVNN